MLPTPVLRYVALTLGRFRAKFVMYIPKESAQRQLNLTQNSRKNG